MNKLVQKPVAPKKSEVDVVKKSVRTGTRSQKVSLVEKAQDYEEVYIGKKKGIAKSEMVGI